jgi:hypothetical protein
MNNEHCFTQLWTKAETIEVDGFTLTLESSYDRGEKLGSCVATLRSGGKDEGATERVMERCYAPEIVRSLLNEAGFEVRESEDFNFTLNPLIGNLKTWWVAEKAVVSSQ